MTSNHRRAVTEDATRNAVPEADQPDGRLPEEHSTVPDERATLPDQSDASIPTRPAAEDGPAKPSRLGAKAWRGVVVGVAKQFGEDKLTTWAAALTYYSILSIFPGLLVLIAALRLSGPTTSQKVLDSLGSSAPGPARSVLTSAINNLSHGQSSTAGLLAVVGVLGALWSASGYVGSFMQAANAIYDVPEGRPAWKKLPIRLGITVVVGVIVAASALATILTGTIARRIGDLVGLGSSAVTVWDIAKWPVLVILISFVFATLYWAGPNVRHGGFRWITPGSLLAVVVWIAASAGFAFYVANFGSYNKTYGSVAGVIVFLVWLWISNLAVLLGAEFDAELQRARAVVAGHEPDDEPYMAMRDTRTIDRNADEGL
ncbi:MAG TPA: YihY/virulence factor BrkB family protein [Micromonosporaceae bacterium]|jgi:membrane protein